MSDHPNVTFIKNVYALFAKADISGLVNQFAEDIDWQTPGAPKIPYAGHFHGRAAAAKFFDGLGATAQFTAFEPREFVADGDRVIVFGHYEGKGRATGRAFATDWVMVFTVANGKVKKFKEYFDTASLGAAFS